LFIARVSL